MAIKVWVGTDPGNEGDWGVAANWAPTGVPVSSDDVLILSGSQSVTGSLNQSAVTLNSLRISENYTGSIGSSSGYLQINSTDVTFDSGGQECWLHGTLTTVLVFGGLSGSNMLQLKGDVDTLRVLGGSGTVTLAAASTTLDTLEVFGADGVTVTVPSGVTSLDNVTIDSGAVSVGAPIAVLANVIGPGTLTMTDAATIAQLDLNEGTCKYNSSGTITTLNVYGGGVFTMESSTASSVTISACTMYEGSLIDFQNGLDNVTLTAGVLRHGGELRMPRNKTVVFS